MTTLREAAQELVEFKGPCLDGFVRHVGDHYVEALEAALADSADAPEVEHAWSLNYGQIQSDARDRLDAQQNK